MCAHPVAHVSTGNNVKMNSGNNATNDQRGP